MKWLFQSKASVRTRLVPSGGFRRQSLPLPFSKSQRLLTSLGSQACMLTPSLPFCHLIVSFWFQLLLCPSHKDLWDYILLHPNNPGHPPPFKSLTLTTSVKSFLLCRVTFTGSRDQDMNILGGHYSPDHRSYEHLRAMKKDEIIFGKVDN